MPLHIWASCPSRVHTENAKVPLTLEQKNELYRWWNRLNNELSDLTSLRVQPGEDVDFSALEASLQGCLRFIENRLAEDGAKRRQQLEQLYENPSD